MHGQVEIGARVIARLLESSYSRKTYAKGSYLFYRSEIPDTVFLVTNGLVGLVVTSSNGKNSLYRLFSANQLVGHRSLISEEPYHGDALLLESSEVALIKKDIFLDLIAHEREVCMNIGKVLAHDLGRAEVRLSAAFDKSVGPRIAESLLYLLETHPERRWTRSEISFHCGSTTATVIRTLAEFEKNGWIEQHGRSIAIVDRAGLIAYADPDGYLGD